MRKLFVVVALAITTLPTAPAMSDSQSSRVIVSATLDGTLHFFDAESLTETQPPLLSRGLAPVRLTVHGSTLYAANHGVQGSVGSFDLSGDIVLENVLSPFPARPGSVGIAAEDVNGETIVAVTNTYQALGGCGLPKGSVTTYKATGPALIEMGTAETTGAIPYAVALDTTGNAYVSSNCSASLDTFDATTLAKTASRVTGNGPDAVLYDKTRDLIYVTNIGGNSLSVFDPTGAAAKTTVALPSAGPIDATLADSNSGASWVITSNGSNDTVSLIDRDITKTCVDAQQLSCPAARVATIFAGVARGAPEGVAYDPATNRIFVVNKTIGAPAISVIQLYEVGSNVTGQVIMTIPLHAAGETIGQLPSAIAFDVVVQTR